MRRRASLVRALIFKLPTLAEMKEWRGGMGEMVTFGLAVGGSWAQVYGRTGTGQPGASGGSVHEFSPQCAAVAQHAVCKPGQVGKRGGCGTPESQWSQNGGGELIA